MPKALKVTSTAVGIDKSLQGPLNALVASSGSNGSQKTLPRKQVLCGTCVDEASRRFVRGNKRTLVTGGNAERTQKSGPNQSARSENLTAKTVSNVRLGSSLCFAGRLRQYSGDMLF
eukprot:5156044-Amphidinium_carterae.1